jgi:diguanylate cyclase (GGDEF)-like protein
MALNGGIRTYGIGAMNDSSIHPSRPATRGQQVLPQALLDSRHRWRDLVTLGADIAYETDAFCRFGFLAPDPALGWPAATLIGQPAELLLAAGTAASGFNPVRVTAPVRRRGAWLKRADGSTALIAIAAAPVFDSEQRIIGSRGTGIDTTEFDVHSGHVAASLRRGEILDHLLWRMGQEVLAPRMMQAVLDALVNALGAEGAAVIDATAGNGAVAVHRAGGGADEVVPAARLLLSTATGPTDVVAKDGRPILVAACHTRFGARAGISLWRSPGLRGWDPDDKLLIESAASLIRMVLEHETIQQEMARQARTDPLTGLLNRRAFLEELERHIDRLDREDAPGTLLFADLDDFKPVNDRLGHDVGDQVLLRTAAMLRNTVRPTDLIARLGGDEFALWLNGADHMTAAERAEHLCRNVPRELQEIVGGDSPGTGMSIGIATREAGSDEAIDSLMRRADKAMYEVKRAGRGHWRVAAELDVT